MVVVVDPYLLNMELVEVPRQVILEPHLTVLVVQAITPVELEAMVVPVQAVLDYIRLLGQ